MPFLHNKHTRKEPKWKDWDRKANKNGLRKAVFTTNGDVYVGEWMNNLKHGKGIYKWKRSGAIYEGDWAYDKRHGFGTYSTPYKCGYLKQYSGMWANGFRNGYGTYFYKSGEYYEGEFKDDEMSGWGLMVFADGSTYEGEWYHDTQCGEGMTSKGTNIRYEGEWKNGMKNGFGRLYYLHTGQMYEGVWVDDVAKCGSMIDYTRNVAVAPTPYSIPQCELKDVDLVLGKEQTWYLNKIKNQNLKSKDHEEVIPHLLDSKTAQRSKGLLYDMENGNGNVVQHKDHGNHSNALHNENNIATNNKQGGNHGNNPSSIATDDKQGGSHGNNPSSIATNDKQGGNHGNDSIMKDQGIRVEQEEHAGSRNEIATLE